MARKKQTEIDSGFVVKYDAEAIANIALKVKASGFVPVSVLQKEFGEDKVTQAVAILFRDFRLFREVRRPWKNGEALGYEWADKRFSKAEEKKVPEALGFMLQVATAPLKKYADFEPVVVKCRWTTPILGSVPVKGKDNDTTNCFERSVQGEALVLRYNQRAMATVALPMIGKEAALARRIGWGTIRIPINGNLTIKEHGIVEVNRAGGKGLRRSESLPDGIEFEIRAMLPTSHIKISEFLQMLRLAGEHVGLSPGRSSGFGDFEVLGAE